MDANHGHAHLLAKVGIITRMSQKTQCSMEGVWIGHEHVFSEHPEMAPIFFMACMTNSRHRTKFLGFSKSFAFSGVFSVINDR